MNNVLKVLILASIGGLIGYITNVVAIRLIFRPIEPIKIPFINKEIIGLIPKRRSEIASNIGEVIAEEFLSIDEILDNAITEKDKEEVVEYINEKIKSIVNEKMAFVPSPIKSIVLGYISESLEEEIKNSINELEEDIITKANKRIDIKQMVEDKINELDLYYLEEIIIKIVKKELRHIEILGLILGFVIGIVQGFITIII